MTKIKTPKHQLIYRLLKNRTDRRGERTAFFKAVSNRIAFAFVLLSLFSILMLTACQKKNNLYAPFLFTRSGTIDSLLEVMTLDEKLGQLIFVETMVSNDEDLLDLSALVKEQKISGILSTSNYLGLKYLTAFDSLQKLTSIPLLFGLSPNNENETLIPSYHLPAIVEDSIKEQIIKNNQSRYNNYQYDIAFDIDL